MFDWFYHTCPRCNVKSRRRVLRNELINTDKVEMSRTKWSRGGNSLVKEPFAIWLYSYEVEHICRGCGNKWVEHVTKQRPW